MRITLREGSYKTILLQLHVFFEPTDRRKAVKIFGGNYNVQYASPNLLELRAMAQTVGSTQTSSSCELTEIVKLYSSVSNVVQFMIVTMGSKGVITMKNVGHQNEAKFYPTEPISKIESVSGAGDCFASGFIHGMLSGYKESHCIFLGFEAAKMALLCKHTVPSNINIINKSLFKEPKYELIK